MTFIKSQIKFTILLVCSVYLTNAQENLNNSKFKQLHEELPTPNVYRTASGVPGHEYYQQKAEAAILSLYKLYEIDEKVCN